MSHKSIRAVAASDLVARARRPCRDAADVSGLLAPVVRTVETMPVLRFHLRTEQKTIQTTQGSIS